MAWTIKYTDTALKQLKKLDKPTAKRLIEFLDQRIAPLADARAQGKALSGRFRPYWRYRVGDYRIVCDIDDSTIKILVVQIGHRKGVYE